MSVVSHQVQTWLPVKTELQLRGFITITAAPVFDNTHNHLNSNFNVTSSVRKSI